MFVRPLPHTIPCHSDVVWNLFISFLLSLQWFKVRGCVTCFHQLASFLPLIVSDCDSPFRGASFARFGKLTNLMRVSRMWYSYTDFLLGGLLRLFGLSGFSTGLDSPNSASCSQVGVLIAPSASGRSFAWGECG